MDSGIAVRFRYHSALAVAAVIAAIGTLPLAGAAGYLATLALLPLVVAVWAWRAGTDADRAGLRVHALLGQRHIPWTEVAGLRTAGRRVFAVLADGQAVALTAVTPADLPRLVAASGHPLTPARDATAEARPSAGAGTEPGATAEARPSAGAGGQPPAQ